MLPQNAPLRQILLTRRMTSYEWYNQMDGRTSGCGQPYNGFCRCGWHVDGVPDAAKDLSRVYVGYRQRFSQLPGFIAA